jgi:phage terminase large subunit-like protein
VDELHAHKDRALWDVLETATGSREQPLLWAITTAGGNQDGVCFEQRAYVTKLLEGVLEDDSYFGIIYTSDSREAWEDLEQWRIANPNFGVSVLPEKLEDGARKARHSAAALNNFLTKHLNIWVSAAAAWMNMEDYKACADPVLQRFAEDGVATEEGRKTFGIPPEFNGRPCWIGGDLASKVDIASLAFVFPEGGGGNVTVFGKHYLPQDLVEERANRTGGHYAQWAKQGWLTLTSGNVIDLDQIEEDIKAAAERFQVLGFAYDPWQAAQMVGHLQSERISCVEVKPTVGNFSPAMKEIEGLIKSRKYRHNGDPCATWMASNVVAKEDFKENVFPRKERGTKKIDFFVALLEAMNRVILMPAPEGLCSCPTPNSDPAGLCLTCERWTAAHNVATFL